MGENGEDELVFLRKGGDVVDFDRDVEKGWFGVRVRRKGEVWGMEGVGKKVRGKD